MSLLFKVQDKSKSYQSQKNTSSYLITSSSFIVLRETQKKSIAKSVKKQEILLTFIKLALFIHLFTSKKRRKST